MPLKGKADLRLRGWESMVNLLRRCTRCGRYTLERENCPLCGAPVRVPHPPKLSLNDRFRPYRRKLREMVFDEKDRDKGNRED